MIAVIILIILIFLIVIQKNSFTSLLEKVYVVSFAHNCCKFSQENLENTAYNAGAYKVLSLNIDTLEAPQNVKEYILNNKRLAGYGLWKPYAMKQILNISNPGDIILYVDSTTYFKGTLHPIIYFINKNDSLCFKHCSACTYYKQYKWTKMNAVKYFGYSVDNWCENNGQQDQFISAFLGIKNNVNGNFIVDKWLESMNPENSELFDDSPSKLKNCDGFRESRHDQQMLSLILYKFFNSVPYPDYNKNEYNWVWHESINGRERHD